MSKKDPNRLITKDGKFQSEWPGSKNKKYSIGYLEDLCEWIYYHSNLTKEEKLKRILIFEKIISEMVKEVVFNCSYVPTWSIKLEKEL